MSQEEKKVNDQDDNVEFDMEKYMEARLKPGARIRLPVPKDAKNLVARVEALEVSPAIKKEILEKHYNIYAQNRTIEISPMDKKDDLFGIFLEHITPEINKHNAGHLTDSEFAKYLSNEYARLIHYSCKKAIRFCEDPGLLGSTYFNAEEVAAGRKFNTTWRGFADLDKYLLIIFIANFSYFLCCVIESDLNSPNSFQSIARHWKACSKSFGKPCQNVQANLPRIHPTL